MGLFDSFIAELKPCPLCDGILGEEYQTKALDTSMELWRIGDLVETEELRVEKGRIYCYTICRTCGAWIDAYAIIDGGRFKGVEISKAITRVDV